MIIDFHTHVFPDAIAERSIAALKDGMRQAYGEKSVYPEHSDGTVSGILNLMGKSEVDKSVIMPIATKEKQTETINEFAEYINREYADRLLSFGSLFPFQKDADDVLKRLHEKGFKGIKLHPEFQRFESDSKVSINILKQAEKLNMMVVFHAGFDVGFATPPKCTPKMIYNVLSEVSGEYIILAHLGGFKMWDEVCKYLVGTKVYMDTAFLSLFIDNAEYRKIILDHGSERILFGSDNPWEDPSDTLKKLNGLGLDESEMENILHKNAERILS